MATNKKVRAELPHASFGVGFLYAFWGYVRRKNNVPTGGEAANQ